MKPVILFIAFLLNCQWLSAQARPTFTAINNAVANVANIPINPNRIEPTNCLPDATFRLTPDQTYQMGQVWCNQTINLGQNYVWEAYLYFGNHEGADGIAFVMHRDNNGGGLGHASGTGFPNSQGFAYIENSIAIEFDDFYNFSHFYSQDGDIADDHLDIVYNDLNVEINDQANFTALSLGQIEDDAWHQVRIEWNPCGGDAMACLTIFFDDMLTPIATHCDSMLSKVFADDPDNVIWGFTAGTGSQTNFQAFCLSKFQSSRCNQSNINAVSMPELDEKTKQSLAVFPNPSTSYLTIATELSNIEILRIFDMQGRLVQQNRVNSYPISISVENLPRGIYTLNTIDKDGNLMSAKFVKE